MAGRGAKGARRWRCGMRSEGGSLVLLGIDGGGARLGAAGLLFQDGGLGVALAALGSGLLLLAGGGGLLGAALLVGLLLALLGLDGRLALGLGTVALGGLLALLLGDLGRQLVALGLRLDALFLELRLGVGLAGLGLLAAGLDLGVGLGVLKATLAGQVLVAGQAAGGGLGLAGELAEHAALGGFVAHVRVLR